MNEQEAQQRIERLERVLGTLIKWMGSSANSPISPREAADLLQILGAWSDAEKLSDPRFPPRRMK